MQKEAPRTPKARRINRPNPGTPDRTMSGSTEMLAPRPRPLSRATMAPGDFAVPAPGLCGKKRLMSCRQSIMPPSQAPSLLDTTRRTEPDNKDLEMKLLYDKYLQTKMIELLMKKKSEEMEKTMISRLGMLAEQEDSTDKQLLSMKQKECDLRTLIEVQDSLDTEFVEITACLDHFGKKPAEILSHLQSMLSSLDMLRCTNIVIPNTPEDMKKIEDLLAKCGKDLKSLNSLIGSKREAISTVDGGLQDFTRAHADVMVYAKKTEEALCRLQVLLLKEAAHSLTQNEL